MHCPNFRLFIFAKQSDLGVEYIVENPNTCCFLIVIIYSLSG